METINFLPLTVIFCSVWGIWMFSSSELIQLNKLFRRRGIAQLANDVEEAHLNKPPEFFLTIQTILALSLFFFGTISLNIAFGILLAGLGWIVPITWLKQRVLKRRQLLTSQLVEGLELLGNGLRSGLSLQQAISMLVREFPDPISSEFARVLAETKLGVDLQDALANMAGRLKLPVTTILSTGVNVTLKCGGDLSEIFEHISTTIRNRASIEGKIQAVSSLGRFQASILSAMPFLLMLILFFVDREHVVMLFDTKIGLAGVGVMVFLVFLANIWIGRMLKLDV
jgi:tight adherence protein B